MSCGKVEGGEEWRRLICKLWWRDEAEPGHTSGRGEGGEDSQGGGVFARRCKQNIVRMGGSKLLVDFEKDKSKTWGARALRAGIETPSP